MYTNDYFRKHLYTITINIVVTNIMTKRNFVPLQKNQKQKENKKKTNYRLQ